MDWREAERAFDDPVLGRTTLPVLFEESTARHPEAVAQRYKGGVYDRSLVAGGVVPPAPDGGYADLTYEGMRRVVRRLAAGFRALGVSAGDRVGIYGDTRMEWAHADFAVLAAGGVVTTVYTSSSERQVRHLLDDADAAGVVVENATLAERVLALADDLDLGFVVVMDALYTPDPPDIPDTLDSETSAAEAVATDADVDGVDVLTLADLYERGEEAYDGAAYDAWLDARDPEDLASLIYTSGTTGRPKGVMLSHWNFRSNVNGCYRRFGPRPDKGDRPVIGPDTTTLSFLPLAHVFERLAGHFLMFGAGATVAYAESPDTLREDFGLVRPTVGTSVPRVYEKLYDAIRARASGSPLRERLFEWAVEVGRAAHEADPPGPLLSLKHRVADRLVFARVREALGGRVDFFISGGGSLSADLCALYHGMGVPILEGYGLTETSPVVSVNPVEATEVGTIGPPLVDVAVTLDPEVGASVDPVAGGEVGELLVRGPNVADGYWNLPAETAEAFVDEIPASAADGGSETDAARRSGPDGEDAPGPWFRTGDVVERRPDGYLVFRERAKQLLVLSTGKNVAPGPIEDAFADSRYVEQCMVLGDGRKFVSALVVPDFAAVRSWADRKGVDLPDDRRDLCRDGRVEALIRSEVDRVNEGFETYERIKSFRLIPEEFTEGNDLLTPTMKKKRRNILDRFADEIEMLYEEA